ncbi:MAG: hypothetical protein WAT36_15525, partial [Chromatiaceae bacterium]
LPENMFVHTEVVEDAEFDDVISSSKILFAVYQDFPHSSNMLAKAAKYKVPVIVADSYCMAERVKAFGLGLTVKQNDVVGTVGAIEKLNRFGVPEPRWEEYFRLHSVNRVVDQFQIILQENH